VATLKQLGQSRLIGLIAAVGMGGLWVDTRSTADVEIAELKDTVRSLKRAENQKAEPDAQLVSDYAALTTQNRNLQEQYNALARENESLKEREARRAADAIEKIQISKAPEKPAAATAPPQSGGRWFVNLESHTSRAVAADRADLLRKQLKPVNVSVAQAEVSGRQYFRIRAAGFESKRDAAQASDWMSLQLSAGPYWIGKAPANPPTSLKRLQHPHLLFRTSKNLPQPKRKRQFACSRSPCRKIGLSSWTPLTKAVVQTLLLPNSVLRTRCQSGGGVTVWRALLPSSSRRALAAEQTVNPLLRNSKTASLRTLGSKRERQLNSVMCGIGRCSNINLRFVPELAHTQRNPQNDDQSDAKH
jgi:FtsZ-binding cell division protein ZapB